MLNQDEMQSLLDLTFSLDSEPIWITDPEGELVFFCIRENGQITEWVWL